MPKKEKWEILAHEYVVSLFPIFMLVGVYSDRIKNIIGATIDIAEKLSNNSVVYLYKLKSWQNAHDKLVRRIKDDSKFLKNIFSEIDKKGKKLVSYAKKISKENFRTLSNRKLNDYYQKYCELNYEVYDLGLLLPLLDFQETTFMSDEVNNFLSSRKASSSFSLLTTPIQDTFNKKQEISLLKIMVEIKKNKRLTDNFKKLNAAELSTSLISNYKNIWQKIKAHTKRYAWVYYVYEGPAADEGYFIDILRDYVRRQVNPRQELLKHKKERIKLKKSQQKILTDLKPDSYHRSIINLAREAVFSKIYRRDLQTSSYYYMSFVLQEIARRLNLSLKQVRMMLPEEVELALINNRLDVNELNRRMKLAIVVSFGRKLKILTGQKAIKFSRNIKIEKVKRNIKEIKGSTAQPGKAKGVAKLINSPDDMKKMNNGDILISASTNPNLMPAIRQAAAIVTDEGGLTCHAAIVSREFKIPCVVGTNFVTQIIKDGDKVEVDATKGIVKKL